MRIQLNFVAIGKRMRFQSFMPDSYYRRRGSVFHGDDGMEICIQRYDDQPLLSSIFHDLPIGRAAEADITRVDNMPSRMFQQPHRPPWQALIKQDAVHAATTGKIRSSKLHAANAKAWRMSSISSSGYSTRKSSQSG